MSKLIQDIKDQIATYYDDIIVLLPKIILAVFVLIFFWFAAGVIYRATRKYFSKSMDDLLLAKFLAKLIRVFVFIIAFVIALRILGLNSLAGGVLGTAGLGAFIFGFAFKDIGEHFLAGIILAFNRPFGIGDFVELGGQKGKVIGLQIRSTHIKTLDGKDVYIPNGNIIKNALINYTIDGYLRYDFDLRLNVSTDLDTAIRLVLDTLKTEQGVIQDEKKPSVYVDSLGSGLYELKVYYWVNTLNPSINLVAIRQSAIKNVIQNLENNQIFIDRKTIEIIDKRI